MADRAVSVRAASNLHGVLTKALSHQFKAVILDCNRVNTKLRKNKTIVNRVKMPFRLKVAQRDNVLGLTVNHH